MSLRRYINRMACETVVVHTKAGTSIRGVLVGVHRDSLVLVSASHLSESGSVSIDGEAVIPRGNVEWIQRLPVDPS